MSSINITLPDGSIRSVDAGSRPIDIAKSISPRLADAAIVGSALVRRMGEAKDPVRAAEEFLRQLVGAS